MASEHNGQKRVLVVTPRFPFDHHGACEQDRAAGISMLTELGYDVRVVSMCYERHIADVREAERTWGVTIIPVRYAMVGKPLSRRILQKLSRIPNPLSWDGAAHEYRGKEVQGTVEKHVDDFRPDIVWFDSSYLWPLHHIPRSRGIPIVTRSLNYEPLHFLGKTKRGPFSYLKYLVKEYGERQMLASSSLVFAITPKEKGLYERRGGRNVVTLPLRRLGSLIGRNAGVRDRAKLNICFMGSNFSVHHMLEGLRFVIDEVNPLLQASYPDTFTVHIIGNKIPEDVRQAKHDHVTIHGYVKDLDLFLSDMDIALSPSLSGEGMQQKVFEPLVRGIPTITSDRALAGYPFVPGVHLLTVPNSSPAFVEALGELRDTDRRKRMSEEAISLSKSQFSETSIKETIERSLRTLLAS